MLDKVQQKAANIIAQKQQPQAVANNKSTVRDAGAFVAQQQQQPQQQPQAVANNKSTVRDAGAFVAQQQQPQAVANNKSTVRDAGAFVAQQQQSVANNKSTVRDAGAIVDGGPSTKKTIRDISSLNLSNDGGGANLSGTASKRVEGKGFSLTPADAFEGGGQKLEFSEQSIVLNRGNIDGNSAAIDAKAQLSLSYESGSWYIQNLSELRNTYIVPTHKTKIESGDIIVIGNKRYIFE